MTFLPRLLGLATVASLLPALTGAQSLDAMQRAMDLGSVLGSEKACNLTFDQVAISAWIDGNVDASNMDFAPMLNTMTMGTEMQVGDMSESSRTAHCRQIERTAKHYGFIK